MRAFVIGNAALDETFDVDVFPRPGESVFGRTGTSGLGGKGANQAVMLGRCGVTTTLSAPIGRDARGDALRRALAAEPLDCATIDIDGVATDTSIVMRAGTGENTIVTTQDAALSLDAGRAVAALDGAAPGDWVVLQGNLAPETTLAILRAAAARGLRAAINPSPLRPGYTAFWPMVDVVFVNDGEATALGEADALLDAGVGQVVRTLGGDGAILIGPHGTESVDAAPAEIVDTTGAGDCFMAVALASACLRGLEGVDARALRSAARAAAIAVSRPGTVSAFPTTAEMRGML